MRRDGAVVLTRRHTAASKYSHVSLRSAAGQQARAHTRIRTFDACVKMETLPELLRSSLFSFLSIKQKFVRCASVCKSWRQLLVLRSSWNRIEDVRIWSVDQLMHLNRLRLCPPSIYLYNRSDRASMVELVQTMVVSGRDLCVLGRMESLSIYVDNWSSVKALVEDVLVLFSRLTSISLSSMHAACPLSERAIDMLSRSPCLTALSVRDRPDLTQPCLLLQPLSKCSSLIKLQWDCHVSNEVLCAFAQNGTVLRELSTNSRVTDVGAAALKMMPLTSLWSEVSQWTHLECLPSTLTRLELEHFDSRDKPFDKPFVMDLGPLAACHRLKKLQLSGFFLWRSSMRPLSKCAGLESLTLSCWKLGLQDFRDLARISSLTELRLDRLIELNDSHLLELRGMQLQRLTICSSRDCAFTPQVLGSVFARMPLRDLWINAINGIKDSDLVPLLDKGSTLKTVGIVCPSNITESSRERFAARGVKLILSGINVTPYVR